MDTRESHRDLDERRRHDEGRVPQSLRGEGSAGEARAGTEPRGAEGEAPAWARPLLSTDAATEYRREWEEIKVSFVDDPEGAVQRVEKLTQSALDEAFGRLRRECDELRASSDEPSTEELRARLHRYHGILSRLGAD